MMTMHPSLALPCFVGAARCINRDASDEPDACCPGVFVLAGLDPAIVAAPVRLEMAGSSPAITI